MNILYLVLTVVVFFYFLLKKRHIDFLTVAFFSTVVYCYPAYFGFLLDDNRDIPITTSVYICLFIQLIILFIITVIWDINSKKRVCSYENRHNSINNKNKIYNLAVLLLSFIGLLLMIYVIKSYGRLVVSDYDKTELLSNSSRTVEYYKYIAFFTFSYAFSNNGKYIKMLRLNSLVLIGYTFLLGHRSFVVMGLIIIFLTFLMKNSEKNLYLTIKKYRYVFLLLILSALFFLFIKGVFVAIMSGQIDLVVERLASKEYYKKTFFGSEANSILFNLQETITKCLKYDSGSYFGMFFSLIPLLGSKILIAFDIHSFEYYLNLKFNTQLDQGIGYGSTYLGEAYATGGYPFLLFNMIFTYLFLAWLNGKLYDKKSPIWINWISIACTYFSFYLFRNGLIFILYMLRAHLYLVILIYVVKWILKSNTSRYNDSISSFSNQVD